MKRSPLKRTTPLPRGKARLERSAPIRARNPKRRAREFARCYGSKARAKLVARRPCDTCGREATERAPNQNSHMEREGTGRKGSWRTVITQCDGCHRLFHDLGGTVRAWKRKFGVDLGARAAKLAREIPADG